MSIVTKRNEELLDGRTLEEYAEAMLREIKDDLFDWMDEELDDIDAQAHEVIKMMAQLYNEKNNR